MSIQNYQDAFVEFEHKVLDLIKQKTGLPTYYMFTSVNKPATQHIQVNFERYDPITPEGEVWEYGNATENDKTVQEYEVYVWVECLRGQRPQAVIGAINHAFSSDTALYFEHFTDSSAGYLRCSDISSVKVPIDVLQYEERSRITLVFSLRVLSQDPVNSGSIESVEITQKVFVTEDEAPLEETYTVSYP